MKKTFTLFLSIFCSSLFQAQTSTNTLMSADPNPFAQYTIITYTLPANDTVSVDISNISGQQVLVLHTNTPFQAGLNRDSVNLGALPNGIYFLKAAFRHTPQQVMKLVKTGAVGIQTAHLNLTDIHVYPNPSSGNVHIHFTSLPETLSAVFTDVSGREVKQVRLEALDTTLDISSLANGLYLLKISNSDNQLLHQSKFLKQE